MSGIVFFATLIIVGVSLTSVIFPLLIISHTYELFPDELNPFEISPWLIPLITINCIIFGIGFGYNKNKLPKLIYNGIRFTLSFEISKKTAIIVGGVIILIYIGLSVEELTFYEGDQFPDWFILEKIFSNMAIHRFAG